MNCPPPLFMEGSSDFLSPYFFFPFFPTFCYGNFLGQGLGYFPDSFWMLVPLNVPTLLLLEVFRMTPIPFGTVIFPPLPLFSRSPTFSRRNVCALSLPVFCIPRVRARFLEEFSPLDLSFTFDCPFFRHCFSPRFLPLPAMFKVTGCPLCSLREPSCGVFSPRSFFFFTCLVSASPFSPPHVFPQNPTTKCFPVHFLNFFLAPGSPIFLVFFRFWGFC